MKSVLKTFLLLLIAFASYSQKQTKKLQRPNGEQAIKFSMKPGSWQFDSSKCEFIIHRDVPAVRGRNGNAYEILLKDFLFTNGTIEYDVELTGMGFPGINFRMSPDKKTGENFYIRSFGQVTPENRTTLQYAAVVDGMSIWDLSDEFQAGATIHQTGWNHVKLVVSGKQMRVYVNEMARPALAVTALEGLTDIGTISLTGNVIYANVVITPDGVENLAPDPTIPLSHFDTRYIRKWMLTQPIDFPFGKDLRFPLPSMFGTVTASDLPDSTKSWKPIQAELRGIVNVSREFGALSGDARRLVWLKANIESDRDQEKVLNLGFSDEIWLFANRQILYTDKNYFGTPAQKIPNSRCTIENSRIRLPLKKGNNEILIGLANYFYGWGIIARLDDMTGIEFKP